MKLFLPGAGARLIPALKSVAGVRDIIVSTNDPFSPGAFLADRSYLLPRFDQPEFIEAVLSIHDQERFDACLPVLDSALLFFARNGERFAGRRFRIAMSDPSVVEIACDKVQLVQYFKLWGLPVPETRTFDDYLAGPSRPLPCFLKPRYPSDRDFGDAIYTALTEDIDVGYWAEKLAGRLDRYVIQPLLDGDEVNIHFFCDELGEPRSIVALRRLAGRPGDAMSRGEIIDATPFAWAVRAVCGAVRLWGANELQAFVGGGGPTWFTELNVRLNGSSPFVKAAGADPFENTVRLLRGQPVSFPTRPRPLSMTQWEHSHFFERSPVLTRAGQGRGHQGA